MNIKKHIAKLSVAIESAIVALLNDPKSKSIARYNSSFEILDDIMKKEENKFLNVDELDITDFMKDIIKSQYQSFRYENLRQPWYY